MYKLPKFKRTIPQTVEGSVEVNAFFKETEPNFIQQVPSFKLVHVKWVQPNVFEHVCAHLLFKDEACLKSLFSKSQPDAQIVFESLFHELLLA